MYDVQLPTPTYHHFIRHGYPPLQPSPQTYASTLLSPISPADNYNPYADHSQPKLLGFGASSLYGYGSSYSYDCYYEQDEDGNTYGSYGCYTDGGDSSDGYDGYYDYTA